MANRNYTLPRGRLYFAPFVAGTQNPSGERFIGNVPELNLTFETEDLDHYASTGGIRQKDDSVVLEVNRSGNLVTDDIQPENVAIVFLGSASSLTVVGATITDEEVVVVDKDRFYQLGMSPSNPSGHVGLAVHTVGPPAINMIVTNSTGMTTYDEGDDYTVDMDQGRIYIPVGSDILAGQTIKVTYKTRDSTRKRIVSGGTTVEGALRFIADNPKGENFNYYMPFVKMSANGDFALVGGDDWQQIALSLEVLTKGDLEAVYCDGQPVFA